MLAGAQLGITMASLGLGAVAEPAVAHLIESGFDRWFSIPSGLMHALSFAIALSIVVFLHMVVGEMAPKSWAISHPEQSAMRLVRPFRVFVVVFRPIIWFLNGLANAVVRVVGVEPQGELAMAHTPADMLLLLDESHGHGDLESDHHELLTRSLQMSGLVAADAMTVRPDIVCVAADSPIDEAAKEAHRTGRTRVIVHEGDLDHVRGFVHAKDILRMEPSERATTTSGEITRKVMVTPEGQFLETLLLEMRTKRQHIAVVVDELGTVVGVVTLEDLLEELIGDFDDESDRRIGNCVRLPDGTFRMSGTTRPDQFKECTGVELPDGDWHTVAGFVIDAANEIPSAGDEVVTPIGAFTVAAMDGYAIDELIVRVFVA